MGVVKVIVNGETKVDLTPTTTEANEVNSGEVFFNRSGEQTVGTNNPAPKAAGIYYTICSTAGDTQQKDITISDITSLDAGLQIRVRFAYNQGYNGTPTLKLNNFAAKEIRRDVNNAAGRYEWRGTETLDLVYDGTYWIIVDGSTASVTYYGVTKLNNAVDSSSEVLAASSNAVKTVNDSLTSHTGNTSNPHSVTAAQVGAAPTTAGVYYGVSQTSGGTEIKQVNIPEITNLYSGLSVRILFTYGNTINNPKLQINTLEATPICWTGTTGALQYDWMANTVLDLVYDTYSNSSLPVWKLVDHQHASTNRWGIVLLNESTISSASDAASSQAVRYLQAELAPIEADTTASEAYTTGQYFSKSGNFCRALTDINKSETFTLNTNYASTKIADWLPQELAYNLTTYAKFTSLSGRVTRVGNMVILAFRGVASEAMSSNTEIIRIPYAPPGSDGQILSMWRANTAYTCRINAGTVSSVPNGRIYINTAISANDNISITGIYFL